MAWVRLDEDFASHPKVVEAGPLGIALQVAALCYCNRHLTDGRVPRATARSLLDFEGIAVVDGMRGDDVEPDYVIGLLVDAGLWHTPGHDCPSCPAIERGYMIHDYLEQQPSREDVLRRREQAAEAGRKGGKAKRIAKRTASETLSETLSEPSSGAEANRRAEVEAESKPGPDPVPDPVEDQDQTRLDPPGRDPDVSRDARDLTREFAQAVKANGHPVPQPERKAHREWLVEMDRLLRIGPPGWDGDPPPPDEVCQVIAWCAADDFERANVRSVPKLRARYSQLRLKALNATPAAITNVSKISEGGRF